ncbi:hypothetical protein NOGI109294_13730 [Nocardiopsis gilva]
MLHSQQRGARDEPVRPRPPDPADRAHRNRQRDSRAQHVERRPGQQYGAGPQRARAPPPPSQGQTQAKARRCRPDGSGGRGAQRPLGSARQPGGQHDRQHRRPAHARGAGAGQRGAPCCLQEGGGHAERRAGGGARQQAGHAHLPDDEVHRLRRGPGLSQRLGHPAPGRRELPHEQRDGGRCRKGTHGTDQDPHPPGHVLPDHRRPFSLDSGCALVQPNLSRPAPGGQRGRGARGACGAGARSGHTRR